MISNQKCWGTSAKCTQLVISWRKLVHQCFREIHWALRRASNDFTSKDLLKSVTSTLQMTPRESPNRLIQQWLKRKDTACLQNCFLGYLEVSVLKTGTFLSSEYQPNSLWFKNWPNKQGKELRSPKQDYIQSADLPCPGESSGPLFPRTSNNRNRMENN